MQYALEIADKITNIVAALLAIPAAVVTLAGRRRHDPKPPEQAPTAGDKGPESTE